MLKPFGRKGEGTDMYRFWPFPALLFTLTPLFLIVTIEASDAQDPIPQRLKEIVVTATRTPVPIEKLTNSVTVIDSETIEAKQVKTVLEVLRDVPGLDVRQSGGPGGNTSHTLVMIDGVQVNSPTNGLFDFADLTVDNIDRIEVIRGPQSTLYGSDAIGGVIHIITKKGTGPVTGYLSSEYGSFNTFQTRAGVSGGSQRFDYAFSASRLDTGGISDASEHRGNFENDSYDNTTFSGRIGTTILGDGRVDITARYTRSNTDIDFEFPVADDPNSISIRNSLVLAATFSKPVTTWWDEKIEISINDDSSEIDDQDQDFDFMSSTDIQSRRLDWQHNFQLGNATTLTAGYELEDEEGENKDNFRGTITNNAAYAQIQANPIEPLSLVIGGRFDSNNRYGDEGTYKISGAYALENLGTTVRSSYGTGFRGPTLNDLFFVPFNNLDLEPETSKGFDAGVEQHLLDSQIIAGVTYFHNDFQNLIVLDSSTFIPENISKARAKGIEATLQISPINTLAINTTYTYTAGRDIETNLRLARRPLHKGNINVMYSPTNALTLNADLLLIGKNFSDTQNTQEVEGYEVIHLAGSYAINTNFEAFFRLENLLNQQYEEVFGFGTFGRSAFGGLKLKF